MTLIPQKTRLLAALLTLLCLPFSRAQSSCRTYSFPNNQKFSSCNDLPVLSSHLHWTYSQASGSVQLAFRASGITSSNWVAWALNPTKSGMVGAQALVAYVNSSGSVHAYTSSVTSISTTLAQSALSFKVPKLEARMSNGEMIIFATVQLPAGRTQFNQVWQVGPVQGGAVPQPHPTTGDNIKSAGTVDFLSGQSTAAPSGGSKLRKKNVHGVLNAVGWGTLLPLGAIIARYMRVFKSADPAWFYLHITCQFSAYVIGVAGWGTGLKLGSESPGIVYHAHRNIGITLFCLATLQVFALLLRPKKDHKYRFYWNIYHHSIGYAVIILSIINIFKGLDILDPQKKWKRTYIGIIIALGAIALVLEAFTWMVVLKRKKSQNHENKHNHSSNGANGYNGYAARTQPVV